MALAPRRRKGYTVSMKTYKKIKNLLFGHAHEGSAKFPYTAPFAQEENIVYLSPKEAAFIYRQNKRITRTLTPDNPLLKKAGSTTHGAWFCNIKQTL